MIWQDFSNLNRTGQIDYLTMQDGTKIRTASWPSQDNSRGIIVLVNGHREYMEKYSEFISELLERNYAVYALDNRGQGLSDRVLPDRSKSHAEDFEFFSNDLNEFISKKVMADPRAEELTINLVAHSMGGHVSLRYLHDFPGIVSKAIIMAPMVGFNMGADFINAVINPVIRFASFLGFDKKFAFGQGNRHTKGHDLIRRTLLTHDRERYDTEVQTIEANPDLYVGGATFGWLNTALNSIDVIHQSGYLDEISTPILVILAGDDHVVNSNASRKLLSGHDDIELVTIEGSRHEIYREIDIFRDQLWQKIDDFLE